MTCIAIIPARGGSRRIPKKNIRMFHGKPIIAYSIEAARKSGVFDKIVVSTDCPDIAEVAIQYGADEIHYRDESSSRDEVGTQEVARVVLADYPDFDYACVIYPCAPMLSPDTLKRAKLVFDNFGYTEYVVPVGNWLQDPGQFYFGKALSFFEELPLLGPYTRLLPIDPKTDCDINTMEDWERAERMYTELKEKS